MKLASHNMAEKMTYMEEKTAEVRQVTRRKMADMEYKASDMDDEISRATLWMKSEIEKM